MTRMSSICVWIVLLAGSMQAGLAHAETIELVTYYPASGSGTDLQTNSLRVGAAYAAVPAPPDGVALIFDSLGIGIPVPEANDSHWALEVRGVPDGPDRVVFVKGADTAAIGAPTLNVGIGTATPAAALTLHVVQDQNGYAQVAGVNNPNTGPSAGTVFLVGQNMTFNTQNGMLFYCGRGFATDVGGYHNPDQFEVAAGLGAVNGLTLVTNGNAPIKFVTNANGVLGNERMRITGDGVVRVGASSLFVQADQGGNLEIGGSGAVANPVFDGMPYIDFHFGRRVGGVPTAQDFNTRLINRADGILDVQTSTGGAAAQTRLSIGNNLGVGTITPQTTSPTGGATTGNLDVNDAFLRSTGKWLSQAGGVRVVGIVGPAALGTLMNTERVLGWIAGNFSGRPVLILVNCHVENNGGYFNFSSRIRLDGTGTNGAQVFLGGSGNSGISSTAVEYFTVAAVHTPSAGNHTYFFTIQGFGTTGVRASLYQMSVLEL